MVSELVSREKVVALMGTLLPHVGLAVSDVARRNRILFVAAEPLSDALAWWKGNRYTFRLRPEVEFVAEQWPALFKTDAGPTVQALAFGAPEAIINVTFGGDLVKFVREVVSLLAGEPEWNAPLKDELPEGWIVTGFPWQDIEAPAHEAFATACQARFNETPCMGSVVGYVTLKSLAAAMTKAGSTKTETMIAAPRGLAIETPFGPIGFRAADLQSTMGTCIGRTTLNEGVGAIRDRRYGHGADYPPSEDRVKALRPAE